MGAILDLKMADQKRKKVTLKSSNHKQQMYAEICQFFDDQFMVDIDVTCHGNRTKVHSLMLAIFCPILRESLLSLGSGTESKENVDNSNVTTLRSLNLDYVAGRPDDMDYLIEFIYRGEVAVPNDRLKGLLETATSLGVTGLVKAIQKIIKDLPGLEKPEHEKKSLALVGAKRPRGKGRPPKRKRQCGKTAKVASTNKKQEKKAAESLDREPTSAAAEKPVRDQKECSLPPKRRFRQIAEREAAATIEPDLTNGCADGITRNSSSDRSDAESGDGRTNGTDEGCGKGENAAFDEDAVAEMKGGGETDEPSPDVVGKKEASLVNKKSVRKKKKLVPSPASKTESRKLWRQKRPVMKCNHCDYETQDKGSYKSHIAKHDPKADRFVCDVCSKTFRSKRGYRCHTRSHYDPEHLHKCAHCEFHTPQKWSWLQHLAVIHKVDPKGNPLSENIKCTTCNKSFVAEHQLKAHMIRKHTVDKPYKCKQCPYASVIKYELDKHISIKHNNERRFLCELCSFRSQTQSGFERHKRSHTGVKPFTCTICGKLYADNRKLKSHLLRHENDEKSWVCHLCGHACRRKDNLQMHLKRIHKTTMDSGSCGPQDQLKDPNSDSVLLQLGDPATCANITLCIPNSSHEMAYDIMNPSVDATSVSIPNLLVYEDHAGDQLEIGERTSLEFAVVVATTN